MHEPANSTKVASTAPPFGPAAAVPIFPVGATGVFHALHVRGNSIQRFTSYAVVSTYPPTLNGQNYLQVTRHKTNELLSYDRGVMPLLRRRLFKQVNRAAQIKMTFPICVYFL
jgi:hypothetical protein